MAARRIVVVGLGPGGVDLLLPAARRALAASQRRVARTEAHPAVAELRAEGVQIGSFDHVYDAAERIDDVYPTIVAELVALADGGDRVAYAVPGSPVAAERSVALLRELASRGEIELDIVPGLSFVELALTRLGVDPLGTGLRVVDAHDPADAGAMAGPVLIVQCDHPLVLADLALALGEHLPPETTVTVLTRLGLPDERIEQVPIEQLHRVEPDHLTSIYVDPAPPAAGTADAVRELTRLLGLAARLRAPGGCPWDADQTHRSLARYLLEESYEVVEALEALPADAPEGPVEPDAYALLADELGDLLYQVVFHTVLASEADAFGMAEVARGIHDKLVRRHPHVFGDAEAASSGDVMRSWEQIKRTEKGEASIVAGLTPGLPSLLYAHKLYRKAASVGLEPGDASAALERIRAAIGRLDGADPSDVGAALGELLAGTVVLARANGVDAESVLTGWAQRFRRRFEAMESLARDRGLDLAALEPAEVQALWDMMRA